MAPVREHAIAIRVFDYVCAGTFGGAAAVAAWCVVPSALSIVPAMLLGMVVGIVAVLPLLLLLASILGGFELIVLSMQVGMFAGMTGAMSGFADWLGVARDGVIIGLLIQVLLHAVDWWMGGEVQHD